MFRRPRFYKNTFATIITLLVVLLGCYSNNALAQAIDTNLNRVFRDTTKIIQSVNEKNTDDSLKSVKHVTDLRDTVTHHTLFNPNPKKAGMYSAILPGLGQLYNRQYWKIPVIYAGIGVSAYYFAYNLNNYNSYRQAYINFPNDEFNGKYTQSQLQQIRDDFERYLDFTVLLAGVGYMIQVLDAIASAHLRDFDISRDLSLKLCPVAAPNGVGFGLVLNVKNRPANFISSMHFN
jgi:hypothetical protein